MRFEDVILGNDYTDSVTWITGICTAKAEYFKDESRILLESVDRTGRPFEFWVPVSRLEAEEG